MTRPPIGVRNNNPFDISLPTSKGMQGGKIIGAPGQSGFGAWPTMEQGFKVGQERLHHYVAKGHRGRPGDTIAAMGKFYAADPNWPRTVGKFSKLGVDEKLKTSDHEQMAKLEFGVLMAEIGGVTGQAYIRDLIDKYGSKPPVVVAVEKTPETTEILPTSPIAPLTTGNSVVNIYTDMDVLAQKIAAELAKHLKET